MSSAASRMIPYHGYESVRVQKVAQKMRPKVGCACHFGSKAEQRKKIADFLRTYGDDIPEWAIKKSVRDLKNWHTLCDCNESSKIISQMKWEQSDWYLCTLKNLATHPDYRNMGLASEISRGTIDQALNDPKANCLVLAVDITMSNKRSIAVAEKQGFRKVTEFSGKGIKPAQVLHWVRYAPRLQGDEVFDNPKEAERYIEDKSKEMPVDYFEVKLMGENAEVESERRRK